MKADKGHTPRTEQNTVCFSGHRFLPRSEIPQIRHRLKQIIQEHYKDGMRWFICGGALGFDTLAALEVISARSEYPDIGLVIAVPCADQPSRWSENDRSVYREILNKADEVIVLSEHYYKGCMHIRNQYMIQHSSVCICFLRSFSGGTGYTVRYALLCGRKVINICSQDHYDTKCIKESSWNYIYTSPSVSGNAHIARSIPSRDAAGRKWKGMSLRFCGRRNKDAAI